MNNYLHPRRLFTIPFEDESSSVIPRTPTLSSFAYGVAPAFSHILPVYFLNIFIGNFPH